MRSLYSALSRTNIDILLRVVATRGPRRERNCCRPRKAGREIFVEHLPRQRAECHVKSLKRSRNRHHRTVACDIDDLIRIGTWMAPLYDRPSGENARFHVLGYLNAEILELRAHHPAGLPPVVGGAEIPRLSH